MDDKIYNSRKLDSYKSSRSVSTFWRGREHIRLELRLNCTFLLQITNPTILDTEMYNDRYQHFELYINHTSQTKLWVKDRYR